MAALVFGVWRIIVLWRGKQVPLDALSPVLALMVYSLGLGLSIGISKVTAAEVLDALRYTSLLNDASQRYPSMSQLYWVGLVALLWLMLDNAGQRVDGGAGGNWRRVAGCIGLVTVGMLAIVSGRTGYYEAEERYRLYAPLAQRIVTEDLDAVPTRLQWPYGNEARDALAMMRAHELSIFREEAQDFWRATNGQSNWD